MKTDFEKWLYAVGLILFAALSALAQEPISQPTPPEEPIQIYTEEIQLNVSAQYSNGRFVPTLTADDLLVVESGDPQTITSMKRVPANVLLLLDTGNELNYVKSAAATRITAKVVIQNLSPTDNFAVMQYNDKIETIVDWTSKNEFDLSRLDNKLLSGKRSRFSEALNAAVSVFKSRPAANRHLVLITDGTESVADQIERQTALRNLLAANITVHVISYTQLEEQSAQKVAQRVRLNNERTKPRQPEYINELLLQILPDTERNPARRMLRQMNSSQQLVIVQFDTAMIKAVRRRREAWRMSEVKLQNLTDDSGGIFLAPESLESMWKFAGEVAGAIGSQYVITYTPKKPVADSPVGEERKVRVSSHCDGVQIRSRQKILAASVRTK